MARRRPLAVMLMVGVTIVVGSAWSPPSVRTLPNLRRFLAVDHASGGTLVTILTDAQTRPADIPVMAAGLKVRVYGVRTGRTIRAVRMEAME